VTFKELAYGSVSGRKSGLCSYVPIGDYFSVTKIIKHSAY
tara:strand:+ start:386 stop:505 length:120 start_codon:yes stop_codon:yes gene_type:complete